MFCDAFSGRCRHRLRLWLGTDWKDRPSPASGLASLADVMATEPYAGCGVCRVPIAGAGCSTHGGCPVLVHGVGRNAGRSFGHPSARGMASLRDESPTDPLLVTPPASANILFSKVVIVRNWHVPSTSVGVG